MIEGKFKDDFEEWLEWSDKEPIWLKEFGSETKHNLRCEEYFSQLPIEMKFGVVLRFFEEMTPYLDYIWILEKFYKRQKFELENISTSMEKVLLEAIKYYNEEH